MNDVVPEHIERFARLVGPDGDEVVAEMDAHAEETGFPTVGPAVGGWLRLLARMVDARRVFEFGSGFGYSAYWFAGAVPTEGEVVLTEFDAENCERAREYLARGGYDDRTVVEQGDAIETVERYDGPFDVVLVDNEKERYTEAFEAVREKVAPGGVVLADNAMTAGPIDFDALTELVAGGDVETTDATRGIADYLETVRAAPDFETTLLPVGEGVAVSFHR
ncbi:O-methyltransferase [Halomarina oriensis]|uniref:Methyltransferase domain-containing protein n=1 Tax=Halomarina oriensis TaxID=671145 RepID=A0A6B0GFR3_9EURY|nr:O-methyltransferase [Halomarina oriensis]MWG33350.1 methyltransferase domain-containing protein [Halomarina oriensis]